MGLLVTMLFFAVPAFAAQYTYNDANQITSVTFDNGKVLTYSYDDRGNLQSIVSNGIGDLKATTTDPTNQAVEVSVNKTIEVTFNKNIQPGANIDDVTIMQDQTPTAYTYVIEGSKLKLTPNQVMDYNSNYTVTIPTGAVQATTGETLGTEKTFSFTTEPIRVTGVSLNKTATSIDVDATETLVATIAPSNATNQNVTWTSSNAAVATVGNDGTVTGISAGTAVITVTTADGGLTDTCDVTVSPIVVTGVSLNKTSTTIEISATETLVATIAPSNATNQNVTWTSSDTDVATVGSDGTVTGVSTGTATITVTTSDGSYTATCDVTVQEGSQSRLNIFDKIKLAFTGFFITVNSVFA